MSEQMTTLDIIDELDRLKRQASAISVAIMPNEDARLSDGPLAACLEAIHDHLDKMEELHRELAGRAKEGRK